MDIVYLREFAHLAKTLNFTKTARALNLSQSTLSTHVAKLEKEVGVELVDRTSQSIGFTPAGRDLLETASVMLDAYDGFLARAAERRRGEGEQITVFSVPHVDTASYVLLKRVRAFRETRPEVLVDVRETLDADLAGLIKTHPASCGFYGLHFQNPPSEEGLEVVPLAREEFVVWVDANGPLGQRETLVPGDLRGSVVPLWSGLANDLEGLYREFFSMCDVPVQFSDRFSASREDFFLNRVRDDDVVLLTRGCEHINAIRVRAERKLVRFEPSIYATSYVAFGADELQNPATRAFMDYLREHSDERVGA